MKTDAVDFDYIVIGSGFGGSVSALRLAEKGFSVAVIERGKRWEKQDFPKTNWNVHKFVWMPKLFCYGIQAFTFLRDTMILHGCGVGGGSLVYANTLLVPPDEIFHDPRWQSLGDWQADLAPHYATAQRMMGVATACCQTTTDHMLHEIAQDLGRGETFHPTEVAVFFGEPGKTVPDPYFEGAGPDRAGCTLCGGCMTGCRHNAKNTLDKNYLFFAEQQGVQVIPETEIRNIQQLPNGDYELDASRSTNRFFKRRRTLRCHGIVASAGVMGTVPLLMNCKANGSLGRISDQLGRFVRTNSEAIVGSTSRQRDVDFSQGIAIASGFRPDDKTQIEMCRYGAGHDFMSLICTVLTPGGPPWPRWMRFIGQSLCHPLAFLRLLNPIGWARRSGILLVMQSLPNHMSLKLRRRWYWPFGKRVTSIWDSPEKVPKYIPVANDAAERLAKKMDGDASASLTEVVFNLSTTAHVLGGCPMGRDENEGVIDKHGQLFGYENFYVADGSIIPVNLSVNPSLTILALSEWIMSHVPPKQPDSVEVNQADDQSANSRVG